MTFKQSILSSFIQKYIDWLLTLRGKIILTGSLLVITAFFLWHLQFLAFDFEFEKFFPRDHPDSKLYQDHVAQFGYDNDFLHIILENEPSVFDTSFLKKVLRFEKSLHKINDVEQTYSPLSLQHVIKSPTGLVIFPLVHVEDPTKLNSDSTRIFGNEFYRSAFSANGKALSIYVHHAHFDDPVRSEALLTSLEESGKKYGFEDLRLVGKLSASGVFIRYIQQDFGLYLIGSMILSFGLLLLIFRNLKSALLPFLISLVSIVWMFGLMGFLGLKINLLSSLIPPILFFVSMSDAVHLMNAFRKSNHADKKDELKGALNIVWIPTLLTSVTTAIGFLSLIWINTEPVQNLGLFAAVGILFAFIITFTFGLLIAAHINFVNRKSALQIPAYFVRSLFNNQRMYFAGSLILLAILVPGVFQLEINSFLLDDLPAESKIRQDFEFTDQHLGGSKPYEIRVEVADSSLSIWDKNVMDQIVMIEDYLLHDYPIVKVQSPATIIKYLTMVLNGGLNENFRYPDNLQDYKKTLRLKNRIDPKRMDKLVTEDGKVARLIGFFPELGSHETGKRNEKLLNYLRQQIDADIIKYDITGTTYLIDRSHEMLSKNLLYGLVTAIGIIGIVLGLYFRSWKLLIISLIPNLIPLIMVAGIIGWLGVSIKMTTAIIFAISFGIAVDDTIHIMSSYLQNKEEDPEKRIETTFRHAGNAVVITSLILSAGLCLFLFSSFGATYYLGLFITISLLVALIVDLTLLPLLLVKFYTKVNT